MDDLVQFLGVLLLLGEDYNLVKLEVIKKLNKFLDFLRVVKLHVVLFETMQSQLGVVVDVKLERIFTELLADILGIL